jgi:N6-adenosine-specific RNA methylase IME4
LSGDLERFQASAGLPLLDPKRASAGELRDFAIAVRNAIPNLDEEQVDTLDALLVAVGKRLRQLGVDAAEAECSRVILLRQLGDLLGKAVRPPIFPKKKIGESKLTAAQSKRRHAARLLTEFSNLVDSALTEAMHQNPPRVSLSRMVKICQRRRARRDAPMTDRRFPILYVDPPWRYEGAESGTRQIENQYGTMSLDDIVRLAERKRVPAADDAVLFFWVTSPKLDDGLDVVRAWGFQYRTCMVWVKDKIGMGYYARQQHELLLVAKRGTPPAPAPENRPSSVFHGGRGEHSAKPDLVYELIESMYPEYERTDAENTDFCEMFSRRPRKGWYGWGLDTAIA